MIVEFDDEVAEALRAGIKAASAHFGWPGRDVTDEVVEVVIMEAVNHLLDESPQTLYLASQPVCEGPGRSGGWCQRGGNEYHWHYTHQIVDLATQSPAAEPSPTCPSAHQQVMFGCTPGSDQYVMWCADCHRTFHQNVIYRRPDIVAELAHAAGVTG